MLFNISRTIGLQNIFGRNSIVRNFYQNHYDVLQISRNSSPREIKDAYIKLSKMHHPDRTSDRNSHQKFVKITEAYTILSKQTSRNNYDFSLLHPKPERSASMHYQYGQEREYDPWADPTFWTNRDRSKDAFYQQKPYYGINGLSKVSNATVVIFCLILASFGVGLQILAIRHSSVLRRHEMLERSKRAEEHLEGVREKASLNGNKLQLALLRQKMIDEGNRVN